MVMSVGVCPEKVFAYGIRIHDLQLPTPTGIRQANLSELLVQPVISLVGPTPFRFAERFLLVQEDSESNRSIPGSGRQHCPMKRRQCLGCRNLCLITLA